MHLFCGVMCIFEKEFLICYILDEKEKYFLNFMCLQIELVNTHFVECSCCLELMGPLFHSFVLHGEG